MWLRQITLNYIASLPLDEGRDFKSKDQLIMTLSSLKMLPAEGGSNTRLRDTQA